MVDKDLINLELKAAVSAIDPTNGITLGNGFEIAAFTRRETSTTVEMRDGESFAIAGLLRTISPTIPARCRGSAMCRFWARCSAAPDYQRSQTELVIIVTAHLVTPTRGEALALPTDRIKPPTEKDLFLFGRTCRRHPHTRARARRRGCQTGLQRLLWLCAGLITMKAQCHKTEISACQPQALALCRLRPKLPIRSIPSFYREAGALIDTGNFGNATMNNRWS